MILLSIVLILVVAGFALRNMRIKKIYSEAEKYWQSVLFVHEYSGSPETCTEILMEKFALTKESAERYATDARRNLIERLSTPTG